MTTAIAPSIGAPRARLVLVSVARSFSSSATCRVPGYYPSDVRGGSYSGVYEAGLPTAGPLGEASALGAPRLTPKMLKAHLDQFVVGQERAKKVLSVAVYNHYQRIQELERQELEEQELLRQKQRQELGERHALEDEYPGQQQTVKDHESFEPAVNLLSSAIQDLSPLTIDKSNVMLLGPSGVGKTLMAKTLARVLQVPFSMSDCTPFTQAGYIGEDAEVCVQRLLAAANWDVAKAERGIICLDEIDKISTAKVSHGKDVSGEGVQQALLKIVEGTTLQVTAKSERNPSRASGRDGGRGAPSQSGSNGAPPPAGSGGKGEVYNVRTDNILFIFTGAFVGLQKVVLDRVSKGSIGFNSPIRSSMDDKSVKGDHKIFENLPFFSSNPNDESSPRNPLDLVEPRDLQTYGLIPELIGRIPVTTALSALDTEALVRVLTEPRNSLVKQFETLLARSNIELRFTSAALREIAKKSGSMGTGARGLRTVMERLLTDAMFETPGSSVRHILITEDVALMKEAPIYFSRGERHKFHAMIAAEEERWERKVGKQNAKEEASTFEEYRAKQKATGIS